MKTKYKYIHFITDVDFPDIWLCRDKNNLMLADITYYNQWHQYVASFNKYAVFSADCLVDIADFINQLNKEKHKDMILQLLLARE